MNDIDIYTSLIDDIEANSILKYFNCNVRLNNLELKKTKIKTIIRSNHSIKKTRENTNPFLEILKRHKISKWDNLDEKEFLITLSKSSDTTPDYVKFANLITKYPDKKNEYIEFMINNKNEKKYIFDFDLKFDNEDEIIKYYSKLLNNREDIFTNIKEYFVKVTEHDLLDKNIEIPHDIKHWDIVKLFESLETDNDYKNIFIKFQYIRTHNDMDKDILNNFYFDIIFYLYMMGNI